MWMGAQDRDLSVIVSVPATFGMSVFLMLCPGPRTPVAPLPHGTRLCTAPAHALREISHLAQEETPLSCFPAAPVHILVHP